MALKKGKALVKGIKKQKEAIRDTGFEPTWELFEKTFGWFQISKQLSESERTAYKLIWESLP